MPAANANAVCREKAGDSARKHSTAGAAITAGEQRVAHSPSFNEAPRRKRGGQVARGHGPRQYAEPGFRIPAMA